MLLPTKSEFLSIRAVEIIKEVVNKDGSFLKSKHTLENFRKEFLMPSEIIDRGTRTHFESAGYKSAIERAHEEVEKLLAEKEPRQVPQGKKKALIEVVRARAKKYGMEKLPIGEVSTQANTLQSVGLGCQNGCPFYPALRPTDVWLKCGAQLANQAENKENKPQPVVLEETGFLGR